MSGVVARKATNLVNNKRNRQQYDRYTSQQGTRPIDTQVVEERNRYKRHNCGKHLPLEIGTRQRRGGPFPVRLREVGQGADK